MVREDLVDYIRKAEDRGLSVEQVKAILLKAGHAEEQIELAILETHKRSRVGRTVGFHPAILYFFIIPVIIVVVVVGIANYVGNGDVGGGVVDIPKEEYSIQDVALFDEAIDNDAPYVCRSITAFDLKKKCFEVVFPEGPFVYKLGLTDKDVIRIAIAEKNYFICEQVNDKNYRAVCVNEILKVL